MRHTPAPWKVAKEHLTVRAAHPLSKGSIIAEVSMNGVDQHCATANVHLIAAAPELLQALQWLAISYGTSIQKEGESVEDVIERSGILKDAYEAINKAINQKGR